MHWPRQRRITDSRALWHARRTTLRFGRTAGLILAFLWAILAARESRHGDDWARDWHTILASAHVIIALIAWWRLRALETTRP